MGKSLSSYMSANSGSMPAIAGTAMQAALAKTVQKNQTGSGGGVTFLSFSGKTGIYAYGQKKDDVDGHIFVVEPQVVVEGWTCWKGGKPVDRHSWSIYTPENAVAEEDLKDHGPYNEKSGEGWKTMQGFGIISIHNSDDNALFSSNAVSAKNAISDLLDEIQNRSSRGEPHIPLITFEADKFFAQEQWNYKPVLNIEAWVERDAVAAFYGGTLTQDHLLAGDEPKAAPKKAARKTKRKKAA